MRILGCQAAGVGLFSTFFLACDPEDLSVLPAGVLDCAGPVRNREIAGIRPTLSYGNATRLPKLYMLGTELDASFDGPRSEGGLRRRPRKSRHAYPLAGDGETS